MQYLELKSSCPCLNRNFPGQKIYLRLVNLSFVELPLKISVGCWFTNSIFDQAIIDLSSCYRFESFQVFVNEKICFLTIWHTLTCILQSFGIEFISPYQVKKLQGCKPNLLLIKFYFPSCPFSSSRS